jgi:hypothetical protein
LRRRANAEDARARGEAEREDREERGAKGLHSITRARETRTRASIS